MASTNRAITYSRQGLPEFFEAFFANVFLDLAENITHAFFLSGWPLGPVSGQGLISPSGTPGATCLCVRYLILEAFIGPSSSDRRFPRRGNAAPAHRRHRLSPPLRSRAQLGILAHEFGRIGIEAQHVLQYQYLAVTGCRRTNALDGGNGNLARVILAARGSAMPSSTTGKGARLGHRLGIGQQGEAIRFRCGRWCGNRR